jgi:predicted PolB exonuclease-like 3'-5' exonuclease
LLHNVAGLHLARYSTKYVGRASDHHIDLCEELAGRDGRNRIKLDQACRFLGVEGKTAGMDGAQVSVMTNQGKFREIADYCADDVAATMRLFYRREVHKNRLDAERLQASLDDLETAMTRFRARS